jgi:hypothetical protein
LGCSLFARHYSGNRDFFPFLGLLRCFSSPAYHCSPYVFRREHARITTRRFPHSEIPGSKVGQHLPRAYRSRPRPSSALGAKASTVCSCSLDRKEHFACFHYGVFKVHADRCPREDPPGRTVSQNSTAYVVRNTEVDVLLGELGHRTTSSKARGHRTGRTPTGVMAPASLERR